MLHPIAALVAAARADRWAHTPSWLVAGPGVYCGSRAFDREDHARDVARRLNLEYGLGTHTVHGQSGEVVS